MSRKVRVVALVGVVVAIAVTSGVVLTYQGSDSPPSDSPRSDLSAEGVTATVADGWHDLGHVEYPSLGPAVAVSGNSIVLAGGKDPALLDRSLGTTNALLVDLQDGSSTKIPDLPKPLLYPAGGSSDGSVVVIGRYCNEIAAYSEDAGLDACSPNKLMAFAMDLSKASDGWTELHLPDEPYGLLRFMGASAGRILFALSGEGKAIVVDLAAGTATIASAPDDASSPEFCLDGPDLVAVQVTDSASDQPNPGDGLARSRSAWVKPAAEPDASWRSAVKSTDQATTAGIGLRVVCSEGGTLVISRERDGGSSRFDRTTGTFVPILDPPLSDPSASSYAETTIDSGVATLVGNSGQSGKSLYRYTSSEDRWSVSSMPELPAGLSVAQFTSDKSTVVFLAKAELGKGEGGYRLIVNTKQG